MLMIRLEVFILNLIEEFVVCVALNYQATFGQIAQIQTHVGEYHR